MLVNDRIVGYRPLSEGERTKAAVAKFWHEKRKRWQKRRLELARRKVRRRRKSVRKDAKADK